MLAAILELRLYGDILVISISVPLLDLNACVTMAIPTHGILMHVNVLQVIKNRNLSFSLNWSEKYMYVKTVCIMISSEFLYFYISTSTYTCGASINTKKYPISIGVHVMTLLIPFTEIYIGFHVKTYIPSNNN